ncbi:coiled-coil domain-containing protein 69 isoform X1 [Grammomys surdaster]|uniref:coiled-coil domain-containing protein 69 isoform X1 n=1 Tax=Grammomys surdaster TaxID=491861 RepID=UPI00109EF25D|nr:coiled-coil domain-containing protein 69 isoform X1 [Grammomys surdaster]
MGCRHSRHSRTKRAEKVEETQTELLETLDREGRLLEGRHEEAGQVPQTSKAQEKDTLSDCIQETEASLQLYSERSSWTVSSLRCNGFSLLCCTVYDVGQNRSEEPWPSRFLLEATQAKMNKVDGSILSRLYKNHIQDYGSPGPFWEQELESLHHVIEMKNERIHELEKQLLLLEMLKEKNLILALKNTTLRQEVEDLQFQTGNKLAMSRQLRKDLLQGLEKESQNGHCCSRRRSH